MYRTSVLLTCLSFPTFFFLLSALRLISFISFCSFASLAATTTIESIRLQYKIIRCTVYDWRQNECAMHLLFHPIASRTWSKLHWRFFSAETTMQLKTGFIFFLFISISRLHKLNEFPVPFTSQAPAIKSQYYFNDLHSSETVAKSFIVSVCRNFRNGFVLWSIPVFLCARMQASICIRSEANNRLNQLSLII